MSKRLISRRQGRPERAQEEDLKEALLLASEKLFTKLPYDKVSIRDIALEASVNSALITYYFKNKKGIYYAFLDKSLGEVLKQMQLVLEETTKNSLSLESYIFSMLDIFYQKPWVPPFIFRELLSGQQEVLRFYVNAYVRHAGEHLPRLLERQNKKTGLNPRFSALTLLSMLTFPYVAQSLTGPAFGINYDAEFRDRLAKHILLVIQGGVFESAENSF